MCTSPKSAVKRLLLGLLGSAVSFSFIAGMASCGGSSASPKTIPGGGGGGGGGSRQVNDVLFAADFKELSTYPAGWCPTDSKNNVAAVSTLRIWDSGMKWQDLETAAGVYDWSNLDFTVNTLATNPNCPMKIIYTVGGTPQWASVCAGQPDPSPCLPGPTSSGYGGGIECAPGHLSGQYDYSCLPPSDLNQDGTGTDAQFQAFIAALADRYAGKIAYYEVWNEGDSPNYWCPDPSYSPGTPAICTGSVPRLIRMGWDLWNIVHCADPNAQVLSPSFHGPTAVPGEWMNQYSGLNSINAPAGSVTLPASGKTCTWNAASVKGRQTFDITNFHGRGGGIQTTDPTQFLTVYQQAVGEIQRDNLPTPNGGFFDDENGYIGTDPSKGGVPTVYGQAAYVAISYVLRASVTNPAITLSAWYAWDYPTGTLQGTDAGLSYDVVAGWLSGATVSNCSISGTIYSCPGTTSAGKTFTIMFDSSLSGTCDPGPCSPGSPQPIPSAAYSTATDVNGNTSPVSGSVQVGYSPVLLQ
ncbi:MAG TPA: hypothetical protein VKQ11_21355 [Candidatus Sulfotelmatobacter sp.]|nr:hypothetical protein [Candidatus Sulfotelmatobacter sp.]